MLYLFGQCLYYCIFLPNTLRIRCMVFSVDMALIQIQVCLLHTLQWLVYSDSFCQLVTSIYVLVTRELKKRRNRLGVHHNERTSQNQSMSKNNKKQRQLALQIITINSLEVFSFILIVNLGILQAYQEIFENINFIPYILIVGSINSFFIAAVPIVTMIFLKSI